MKSNVDVQTLCKKSAALFIATPDNAIADAYRSIKPFLAGQKFVFHFSGALPSTIFPKKRGVHRAAAHPFATFPRLVIPPKRRHFPVYIEGDVHARAVAKRIFQGPHFSIRFIPKKSKVFCHLTGVFASNFIVALLHEINALMKHAGMTSRDLHAAILPIIKDTLLNVEEKGLLKALSGPLQRGDIRTIRMHLKALRRDPVVLKTYRILSLSIVSALPDSKVTRQLQKVLGSRKKR